MNTARAIGLLLGVAAESVVRPQTAPVERFTALASTVERWDYRDSRAVGVLHAALLTGPVVFAGIGIERLGKHGRVPQIVGTAVATWAVLGGTAMAGNATAMGRELDAGQLDAARTRLPRLAERARPRDTTGVARATVESVAQHTAHQLVAPLFWGAVAGVPGLLGYRAANALDTLIGHRNPRYLRFGWASARVDDIANLLPARLAAALTTVCAPVVGGSARHAWQTWRRDAAAHPSPNGGPLEAAFAGALEIRLGGRTELTDGTEERPVLGDGRSADAGHVMRAVELSRVVGSVAVVASAALAVLFSRR